MTPGLWMGMVAGAGGKGGPIGVFFSGQSGTSNYSPIRTTAIDYINIDTLGNAASFGSVSSAARTSIASGASETRGVFAGGYGNYNIDYITFATKGNSSNFGSIDLGFGCYGCSSPTKMVINASRVESSPASFRYLTIATTGNTASGFGNYPAFMTSQGNSLFTSAFASATLAIFTGYYYNPGTPASGNQIYYTSFASGGTLVSFGILTSARSWTISCASDVRGVIAGGYSYSTSSSLLNIDFIALATTGNSTNFGNLISNTNPAGACSSKTRGVFSGGGVVSDGNGSYSNQIQHITIATTGNAADFGDLTIGRSGHGTTAPNFN